MKKKQDLTPKVKTFSDIQQKIWLTFISQTFSLKSRIVFNCYTEVRGQTSESEIVFGTNSQRIDN